MGSGDEERMSPEVLNTALMYKIVKRLENIQKILSDQIPLGIIYNIPDGISLTAGDTYVDLIKGIVVHPDSTKTTIPSYNKKLHSISIENQGASSVVVTINPDHSWGRRTLDNTDIYNLDMKKAIIEKLKFTTDGTCTVQISGVI